MDIFSKKSLPILIIFILFLSLSTNVKAETISNEEKLVILSDDLFDSLRPGGPNEFDRILISQNPEWESFQQEIEEMDGELWTAGQIFASFAWGYELGTGVNPAVILVTYGVENDWELPKDGDLVSKVDQIRGQLNSYWEEIARNEIDLSQYPQVANGATYTLYSYFNEDQQMLNEWSVAFKNLFTISPEQPALRSTNLTRANDIAPFLQRPFAQTYGVDTFYYLSSFFDHHYPIYSEETCDPEVPENYDCADLYRFDGTEFEDIPEKSACGTKGDLGAGTYCYSGHPALDYPIFEGAQVKAAAAGKIIWCDPLWGALFIEHDNGLYTSYLHMDPLVIPNDIACNDVNEQQPSVVKGEVIGYVSRKNPSNDPLYGIHLHFGVGYEPTLSERQNIDPFGWWGDGPDPWKEYQSTIYSGLESTWLWIGDERGDGVHVVDNSETQAQLFNAPFELGDWNWVESGYPEPGGDAWRATLSYNPKRTSVYWGIWGTTITEPGVYLPQAYWPGDPDPNSDPVPYKKVAYTLYYHNQQGVVQSQILYADQSRNENQFVTLCEVPYDNDPEGCPEYPEISFGAGPSVIILNDVSEVPVETGKYMVFFDAIKWEEVIPTPTPTDTPTPPVETTITIQVDHESEDAGIYPEGCSYSTYENEIYIGKCDNGSLITSGFRFGGVPIPPGANILEAYLEFTVDGSYDLPVSVLISGENSGDAQPFGYFSHPTDRPQTSAGAVWEIPASDTWIVGEIRRSPEMKAIVQEIVSRPDWASGQGMAFILDTLNSNQGHRRVIAFDRPVSELYNYPGTEYAARLIVTFNEDTPPTPTPPTPTPPTPTPPTPSPTPETPTPTPEPICWVTGKIESAFVLQEKSLQISGTPMVESPSLLERLAQAADLVDFAPLLYRVRDEYLSQTEEGQHYIALFEEHTTEIAYILFENPDLYQQGYDVIQSFEAHLQALVDGEGGTITITSDQVADLEAILDGVAAEASPDLLSAIQAERTNQPLDQLIGLSMDQAWSQVNGDNLIPAVYIGGAETINEGQSLTRTGSFTDPGSTSWTGQVDYGDGGGLEALPLTDQTFDLVRVYPDDGVYRVAVQISDDEQATGEAFFELTVNNLPPKVTLSGDTTLAEGMTFTGIGWFTDPGADSWTASVDYGDGGDQQTLVLTDQSFDLKHIYSEDGIYPIIVCVADDDGGEDCADLELTVDNLPPSVNAGPDQVSEIGQVVVFSGSYSDPGVLDTHTITWDFGDGNTAEETLNPTHAYSASDKYTVTLTVTDDEGAAANDSLIVEVNHAPSPSEIVLYDSRTDNCLSLHPETGEYTWNAENDVVYRGTVDLVERGRIILLRNSSGENHYLSGIIITTQEHGIARLRVGGGFWKQWFFINDRDYSEPLICP